MLACSLDIVSSITHHHDAVCLAGGLKILERMGDDGGLVIPGAGQVRGPDEGEVLAQTEVLNDP